MTSTIIDKLQSREWNWLAENTFHGTARFLNETRFLDDVSLEGTIPTTVQAQKDGGTIQGPRNLVNFITGANVTLTVADNSSNERIDVTIAAAGSTFPTQTESSGVITVQTDTTQSSKGSYVEAFSSTSFALIGIALFISSADQNETYFFDIATGGSGSETVKIADFAVFDSQMDYGYPRGTHIYLPFSIASASRIAVRASNESSASQRTFSVALTIFG